MSTKQSEVTLLVDAGNTRIKWVWVNAEAKVTPVRIEQQQAEVYAQDESPQQGVTRILSRLLMAHEPMQVTLVHVLGEELTTALHALFAKLCCKLLLVDTQKNPYGIKSAYTNPGHLGADRLIALLAGRFIAQERPVIVIDCGTAVTVDAILPDGRHPGGLILPGLDLLSDSLIRNTQARQMTLSEFNQPVIFARDTAKGIGSGCLFALVGAIEGICRRMCNELPAEPVKIICGGDATRVHTQLEGDHRLEPALVMTGLYLVAEQN